jgi:putative membrane protein
MVEAEQSRKSGLSDYLAAERTFLAWIRTGIALMGFGFVVARFGLFLQALQATAKEAPSGSSGISLAFGTALIVIGVTVNVVSAWNHVRLVRGLNQGVDYNRPSSTALAIALILAVIGAALAIYLVLFQGIRT